MPPLLAISPSRSAAFGAAAASRSPQAGRRLPPQAQHQASFAAASKAAASKSPDPFSDPLSPAERLQRAHAAGAAAASKSPNPFSPAANLRAKHAAAGAAAASKSPMASPSAARTRGDIQSSEEASSEAGNLSCTDIEYEAAESFPFPEDDTWDQRTLEEETAAMEEVICRRIKRKNTSRNAADPECSWYDLGATSDDDLEGSDQEIFSIVSDSGDEDGCEYEDDADMGHSSLDEEMEGEEAGSSSKLKKKKSIKSRKSRAGFSILSRHSSATLFTDASNHANLQRTCSLTRAFIVLTRFSAYRFTEIRMGRTM